ncbi:hypothetical protein ONS95_014187 [Cadophora gregata]|uniref:uncharacterized protein n=1 Tax=Cadophora gregata TaxID=51156 RepID=UPI0026DB6ACA|nr:uncharacterized protein ONS95_014187 [Cadophora gregata]KAK0114702.1 hypothetical protein ONS95_014187 [Cadophora gregata]
MITMDNAHPTTGSGETGCLGANMYSAASSGPQNSGDVESEAMGWSPHPIDITTDHYVQQYSQVHSPAWDGGPNIFEGKHEGFCFVCGSSMELFECQTCDTSYHAACMTPSLDPGDVPDFWFCPHCVARELHLPQPPPTTSFSSPPPLTPSTTPSDVSHSRNSSSAHAAPPQSSVSENTRRSSNRDIPVLGTLSAVVSQPQLVPEKVAAPLIALPQVSTAASSAPKTATAKGNVGRPRRSYSPPRKKSKYSAFSSEVDKALAVIHKELEASAHVGKAESDLRDRIQMLEQELRLKDGQIALARQELELAKRHGGDSAGLKTENEQLKAQISRLNSLLDSKDAELRDWRARLKSMIGE